MYNTNKVTNRIIRWHQDNNVACSAARLQGELYFFSKTYNEKFDMALLDSRFVHWGQGPMLPDVYRRCCFYSDMRNIQVGNDIVNFSDAEEKLFENAMDACTSMSDAGLQDKVDSMWFRERAEHSRLLLDIINEG